MEKLSKYLADYLAEELGVENLHKTIEVGIEAFESTENCTVKIANNKDLQVVKICPGTCPVCKSADIDYANSDAIDDGRRYPFTCLQCNCSGEEVYKEVYIQTQFTKE